MTIGAPYAFARSAIAAAPGRRVTLPAVARGKQDKHPFAHRFDDLPSQRMVGLRGFLRVGGLLVDSPSAAETLRRSRSSILFDRPMNAGDGIGNARTVGRTIRDSNVGEGRFRGPAER